MAHYSRALVAAVLLSAGTALVSSPAFPASPQEQKWNAVQSALPHASPAAVREQAKTALPGAAVLQAIQHSRQDENLQLVLHGDYSFLINPLGNGSSLALDFTNTVCLKPLETAAANAQGLIRRLHAAVTGFDTQWTTRVVVELTEPCTYTEVSEPGVSRIELVSSINPGKIAAIEINNDRNTAQDAARYSVVREDTTSVDLLVAQLSHVARKDTAALTVPETPTVAIEVPASEDDQLLDALLHVRGGDATADLLSQEDPIADQLGQQLRAVANATVQLPKLAELPSAAQDDTTDSFGVVKGDTANTVESSGEVFLPPPAPAPEPTPPPAAPEPAVPADAGSASAQNNDTLSGTPEEQTGTEPPMPRNPAGPGTVESNTAIVSKIQELLEDAQPAGAVNAIAPASGEEAPKAAAAPDESKASVGDPLAQRVNIDFREMDLVNVVAILANKAGINVIAGTDLQGTVTANLQNVTLRQAMDTVLRQNGLGLVEEEGIYRIVTYEEAQESQRATQLVELENAKASEVESALTAILKNSSLQRLVNITSNEGANIVVISGPENRIGNLVDLARQLDVAEPVLPTITEPIKLNYAEPADVAVIVKGMLTDKIGSVSADERGRFVIVKDVPVVVEQVRALVESIDSPMKQVVIDTMVVDVALEDNADTGVNWLLSAVQDQSRRQAALGPDAPNIGNLQDLSLGTAMDFSRTPGSALTFGLLSGDINWTGIISAEIRNQNGRLISNPVLVAVENTQAKISISQEIPFVELRQTSGGGSQTTTEFKEIGTILQVTPTVTHDDHIIVKIQGKESSTAGEFNGIPIEDKREVETNLRMGNGQTIFIGGLRKNANNANVRKVPVLGNIPMVNFLFRSNQRTERVNELLIFMTCSVLDEDKSKLTGYQQTKFEGGKSEEIKVDVENNLYHDMIYPQEMRDPIWKWRRP